MNASGLSLMLRLAYVLVCNFAGNEPAQKRCQASLTASAGSHKHMQLQLACLSLTDRKHPGFHDSCADHMLSHVCCGSFMHVFSLS